MLLNTQFDVFALAREVNHDGKSGALMNDLLSEGHTLYSPSLDGGGIVYALYPCGKIEKGQVIDGQFKPFRVNS